MPSAISVFYFIFVIIYYAETKNRRMPKENAIAGAAACPDSCKKTVIIRLHIHKNKLLISTDNPYAGDVKMIERELLDLSLYICLQTHGPGLVAQVYNPEFDHSQVRLRFQVVLLFQHLQRLFLDRKHGPYGLQL